MDLYWTKRIEEERVPDTEALVRKVFSHCAPELVLGEMRRTIHGRPYFPDAPNFFFSVSHSGRFWGCAVDRMPLGFDLEDRGRKRLMRSAAAIAKRFFTPEEAGYVACQGEEAFFRIWVRKEAALKYAGVGLSMGMDGFEVLRNGEFLERIALVGDQSGTSDIKADVKADVKRVPGRSGEKGTAVLEGLWIEELKPEELPMPEVVAAYCGGSGNGLEGVIEL